MEAGVSGLAATGEADEVMSVTSQASLSSEQSLDPFGGKFCCGKCCNV